MGETTKLHDTPREPARLMQMRVDLARDTEITVQRNVNNHVYVQIGGLDRVTLIIHPHAAKRLIANMEAVLDGTGFVRA